MGRIGTQCLITTFIQAPDIRLSRKEVTGEYAVKIMVKHAQSGTVMPNGGDIIYHRSILKPRP
jgi:hypothetical protein